MEERDKLRFWGGTQLKFGNWLNIKDKRQRGIQDEKRLLLQFFRRRHLFPFAGGGVALRRKVIS